MQKVPPLNRQDSSRSVGVCFVGGSSRAAGSSAAALLSAAESAEGEAKQELSEGQLRLGLVECLNHGLLHPYPVLHEKTGEYTAQVRVDRRQHKACASP